MRNLQKQFTLVMFAAILSGCDSSINSSGGGSTVQGNIFYDAAKNAMPVFRESTPSGRLSMAKASKAAWNWGEPIYEMYNTFKDYNPETDSGTGRTGTDNIYKLLYQNGSFYNECMNYGTTTGDQKLLSPYDFGRTDNTYNIVLNRESTGSADYFAGKKDGSMNYCLLSWYREYVEGHKERGVLQGHFNEVTGDLDIDLVSFVEYATSTYSHRTHLEGNSITHRFTKLLMGKWNGGSASYRGWFVGSGISRGAGNTFLFKIKDNNGLNTDKYFDFPADADVTVLQTMSNAGSDTTSSPFKGDVDVMVSSGEYFDILTATPVPDQIPSSGIHFHGTGMGNMKPVVEVVTELEGKWYGRTFNMTVDGNYFQLKNGANTQWYTGEIVLNTTIDPKQIDIQITDASENTSIGKTVLGIYKMDADTLFIKVSNPGDTIRPVDFTILNGMLLVFGRDPNNLPDVPGGLKEFTFLPLEFPFKNPDDIVHLAAFGIPDWSGPGHPHGDIDLQIDLAHSGSTIISPTYGTVKSITFNTFGNLSNPPDLMVIKVEIYINSEYTVWISFEPGDSIGFLSNQMAEIKVSVGQEVMPGDTIGNLLVGAQGYAIMPITLIKNGNVNLCPYSNSSTNARLIYDNIIATRGVNLCDGKICCVESF